MALPRAGRLGFPAVTELIDHGYASDDEDAVAKALNAGIDIDLGEELYRDHIPALVRKGRVAEATVDEAVRRVLRLKKCDRPIRKSVSIARPRPAGEGRSPSGHDRACPRSRAEVDRAAEKRRRPAAVAQVRQVHRLHRPLCLGQGRYPRLLGGLFRTAAGRVAGRRRARGAGTRRAMQLHDGLRVRQGHRRGRRRGRGRGAKRRCRRALSGRSASACPAKPRR